MSEDVYRDGIEAERCVTCRQMLRLKGGAATVSILVTDVEEIACLLQDYVDDPDTWGETIARLEQAVGKRVWQIKRDAEQLRPAALPSRLDI